jgi:hypothetical protein
MKVGDLVHMPGSIEPITGIVLREEEPTAAYSGFTPRFHDTDNPRVKRVKVYWMDEADVSWEPVKWLEVINPS